MTNTQPTPTTPTRSQQLNQLAYRIEIARNAIGEAIELATELKQTTIADSYGDTFKELETDLAFVRSAAAFYKTKEEAAQ